MVRGLYTAYTGMINEQKRLDAISNNIANANTTGYKRESISSQSFDDVLTIKIKDASEGYLNRAIGDMSLGVKVGEVYTDYTQGSVRQTGNTYDLAIQGEGFFNVNVENQNGEVSTKYTRDGNFVMTSDGYIVDAYGNHLQGESGDIQVPVDASSISINSMGQIYADNTYVDTIILTDFEDYDYLEKFGDNFYSPVDGAETKDATGTILQGFTEQSNVNSVYEMVNMITVTRVYEANQKVMKTIDNMIDLAVNSVGKVS